MIELTKEQLEIKNTILDELGLLNFKPGQFTGKDVREEAAARFPRVLAEHTIRKFDPIAYSLLANDLFLFIIEISLYGDIGIDDIESTKTAIEAVIDTLFEVYENRDNEYRKKVFARKLKFLIGTHPLFRPHMDIPATP